MIKILLLTVVFGLSFLSEARAADEKELKEGIGSSAAVVVAAPKKKKPAPAQTGKLKPQNLAQPTAGETPKDSPEKKAPPEEASNFGHSLKPTRKSLLKPLAPVGVDAAGY